MYQRSVLMMDVGVDPMAILAARIQRLGFRAVRVKTAEDAIPILTDPRFSVGCVVLPQDLPVADLGSTLAALRMAGGNDSLPFLVTGGRMGSAGRSRHARAGVEFPLFEPINAHTLRFQLNRAMSGPIPARRERGCRRAPSSHEVHIRARRRHRRKAARLYTFSARGAFLATPNPSLRGSELELELGIPGIQRRVPARVVMTNVVGNLMRPSLPNGMAIRFSGLSTETEANLEILVEKVLRRLEM